MLPTFTKIFFCIFSDVIIVLCFFSDFIIYELRGFNEEKRWRKMFMDDDEFKNCFTTAFHSYSPSGLPINLCLGKG